MLDLTERIAEVPEREARRAELNKREREHGGLIPSDRETEAARRSAQGWGPYRPDVKRGDLEPALDPRRITLQRLYIDCGAAVRRFAPKFKRERAETLRDDALLLLVTWPKHGATRSIDLGGRGGLPLRRDWLEPSGAEDSRAPREKLTALAWRALHAAVKQAAESPAMRADLERAEIEQPIDALDISALVEQQQRETDAATRLPDSAAPEVISEALSLPLDAARAIVARAYPAAAPRDLAEAWRISEGSLKVALSRGAATIRERFPNPADLLDALDSAAAAWRAQTERDAILALIEYRDTGDAADALERVHDWRGAHAGLDPHALALLGAARTAARRNGRAYGSERAERVALSLPRLLRAEERRARRQAETR